MTAKERFEQPFEISAAVWEHEPFVATAKFGFSLECKMPIYQYVYRNSAPIEKYSVVNILLSKGEQVEGCHFGQREYVDKTRWTVRFQKHGLDFELPAPDFFKLFDA